MQDYNSLPMAEERHNTRRWDWLSAILVFLLIRIAAARLVSTSWSDGLPLVNGVTTLGCVLGLALGASRYGRRAVVWFVIDYTLAIVPWQLAAASDMRPLIPDGFRETGQRLMLAAGQFFQRQPVDDSLFFVAFAALVFWAIAILAGYQTIRHGNVQSAVLPAGVVILMVQVYDNGRPLSSWWLAAYIIVALILLGRRYFLRSQDEWNQQHVFIGRDTWSNIFSSLVLTVTAVVVLAWVLPTSLSSIQSAADTWNRTTRPIRDRLSNAVSSLNSPYGAGGGVLYGSKFGLGNRAVQGDDTVFTVNVISGPDDSPRFYWRGRAYNTYENGLWTNTVGARSQFDPASDGLQSADPNGRREYHFSFKLDTSRESLLFAPSEPIWVDLNSTITAQMLGGGQGDLIAWEVKPPLNNGSVYQVRAEVANPNTLQLRRAGTGYPDWVTASYLEVPSDLQADLQTLTQQVTAGQTNPFDQASAITTYLRDTIHYSANVPAAPAGSDPVLWVLTDYHQGYCNYYAAAEVLMLRSIGIPARLAVGFAEGDYDENQRIYTIHERDAHAWPEVYFPDIGWVEFEPTTSQTPLVRPVPPSLASGLQGPGAVATPVLPQTQNQPVNIIPEGQFAASQGAPTPFVETRAGIFLTILLVGFAGTILFLLYRARSFKNLPVYLSYSMERNGLSTPAWIENWMRWNELQPVERSFASVNLSLRWLGQAQPVHVTPAARAALLTQLLPAASAHIETLTSELQSGLFTRRAADTARARRAGILIILLTWRALLRKDES